MQEYVSEAIVLAKEPLRTHDGRYAVFTKRFGKVIGKTTSSRKILSKLAPHLEPGTRAHVRFIEKNGTRIVDALKIEKSEHAFRDLYYLNQLLPENIPEEEIWEMLRDTFRWTDMLRTLGWDPEEASCATCNRGEVASFFIPRQEFFCEPCSSRFPKNQLVFLS